MSRSPVAPAPRLRHRLRAAVGRFIPYALGNRCLRLFLRQQWLIARLYAGELRLFRDFQDAMRPSPAGPGADARTHIAANTFGSWRVLALALAPEHEYFRWVTVRGREVIRRHTDSGKGLLVVNSHVGSPRIVTLTLSRLGYAVNSLEVGDLIARLGVADRHSVSVTLVRKEKTRMWLREVYAARKVLSTGGIVHLAGDGYKGDSGYERGLLGRVRRFATGFAELAVGTDADVIVAFSHVKADGHIEVDFSHTLHAGPASDDKRVRVHRLIDQYVDLLQDRYVHNAANARWSHMRRFLDLPAQAQADPPLQRLAGGQ